MRSDTMCFLKRIPDEKKYYEGLYGNCLVITLGVVNYSIINYSNLLSALDEVKY